MLARSTRNVIKIIMPFCLNLVHIDAKCNNIRKQNQFASGLRLIMRHISKRLVVLVVFMFNVPVNSFSVMSGRSQRLLFFVDVLVVVFVGRLVGC